MTMLPLCYTPVIPAQSNVSGSVPKGGYAFQLTPSSFLDARKLAKGVAAGVSPCYYKPLAGVGERTNKTEVEQRCGTTTGGTTTSGEQVEAEGAEEDSAGGDSSSESSDSSSSEAGDPPAESTVHSQFPQVRSPHSGAGVGRHEKIFRPPAGLPQAAMEVDEQHVAEKEEQVGGKNEDVVMEDPGAIIAAATRGGTPAITAAATPVVPHDTTAAAGISTSLLLPPAEKTAPQFRHELSHDTVRDKYSCKIFFDESRAPLLFEKGYFARQANSAVFCSQGGTYVLGTVCCQDQPPPDADAGDGGCPLTVE